MATPTDEQPGTEQQGDSACVAAGVVPLGRGATGAPPACDLDAQVEAVLNHPYLRTHETYAQWCHRKGLVP